MLSRGALHEDLGSHHFRERNRDRTKRHVIQRVQKIGVGGGDHRVRRLNCTPAPVLARLQNSAESSSLDGGDQ